MDIEVLSPDYPLEFQFRIFNSSLFPSYLLLTFLKTLSAGCTVGKCHHFSHPPTRCLGFLFISYLGERYHISKLEVILNSTFFFVYSILSPYISVFFQTRILKLNPISLLILSVMALAFLLSLSFQFQPLKFYILPQESVFFKKMIIIPCELAIKYISIFLCFPQH